MLLELPGHAFPFELLSPTVERLFVQGIRVVLAHPEKNAVHWEDPDRYRELYERGVKFQLNVERARKLLGEQRLRAVAQGAELQVGSLEEMRTWN